MQISDCNISSARFFGTGGRNLVPMWNEEKSENDSDFCLSKFYVGPKVRDEKSLGRNSCNPYKKKRAELMLQSDICIVFVLIAQICINSFRWSSISWNCDLSDSRCLAKSSKQKYFEQPGQGYVVVSSRYVWHFVAAFDVAIF